MTGQTNVAGTFHRQCDIPSIGYFQLQQERRRNLSLPSEEGLSLQGNSRSRTLLGIVLPTFTSMGSGSFLLPVHST